MVSLSQLSRRLRTTFRKRPWQPTNEATMTIFRMQPWQPTCEANMDYIQNAALKVNFWGDNDYFQNAASTANLRGVHWLFSEYSLENQVARCLRTIFRMQPWQQMFKDYFQNAALGVSPSQLSRCTMTFFLRTRPWGLHQCFRNKKTTFHWPVVGHLNMVSKPRKVHVLEIHVLQNH